MLSAEKREQPTTPPHKEKMQTAAKRRPLTVVEQRKRKAREAAIAESAVAEAKIKKATAGETLRRQKAEADEAVARACNARMTQLTQNMILEDIDMTHGFSLEARHARSADDG